jgi:hypothetical protein
MRLKLYSTVSAVALIALAGPAAAEAGFSGVGQLHIGGGTADGSFFAGKILDNPFYYGGRAQGYWPLSTEIHLQADLFAQHTDDVLDGGEISSDGDMSRFGGALHLLHPFENRGRLGLAGSIWNTDVAVLDGGEAFLGQGDAVYGLVALEGQFYEGNWTVSGQVGVFSQFSCSGNAADCVGTIEDGTYLRGKLRYFLNDNTQLSLEAQRMWGSNDDTVFGGKSIRTESTAFTLEAEHKFHDSPFSGFLALAHQSDDTQSIGINTADTQTVTLGVRFYLDQPTLKANDRSGAALDTPTFGTAMDAAAGSTFGSLVGGP